MIEPDDEEIAEFLARACNIAVVGCSRDPSRPSRIIAAYLREKGYRVFPVNPAASGEILEGERTYPSLAAIGEPLDIVNVFRRAADIPPVARDALGTTAPVFWMQSGIDHPESRALLTAAGRRVVYDRCIMVEHARFAALNES
jgi:predicted CoA-binding protein